MQTGQAVVGKSALPFGFKVERDEVTHRTKVVKEPDEADILEDAIQHYLMHQSKRNTLMYLHAKYHISMTLKSLSKLFSNTMLYGAYRDNPSYCEAYVDKATFDRMQELSKRNVKENTTENRVYMFSGLILCPVCKTKLKGGNFVQKKGKSELHFKKYRCAKCRVNDSCTFNKVVAEKTMERLLLAEIENLLKDAKIRAAEVKDSDAVKIPQYDLEAIHEEIDRLNYSWQTGKIRKVEQYEKQYAELMEKLEKAEVEQGTVIVKDFSKIEGILQEGWKGIYNNLDDAHKRAFWRSFIQSIEIEWTTETKKIAKVNFF